MPDQTVWTESLIRSRVDVGDLLRAARESLEVSRERVASDLRIRPQYLAAIEEGRFGDLPGPTYVTAFLRSYAGYVGFSPEDIVAAYRHFDTEGEVARPKYKFPLVESERRLPRGAMVLLSVLLLAGAYTAWNFMGRQDVAPPPPVAALPQELAAPPASESAGPAPMQRSDAKGARATPAEPAAAAAAQPDGQAAGTRTDAPTAVPHAAAPAVAPPAPAAPPPPAPPAVSPPAPPALPAPAVAAPPRADGPATAPAPAAPPPSAAANAPPPQQQAAPTPQRPAAGPPVERALPRDRTIRVSRPTILELRDSGSGEVLATVNLRAGDTYTVPSYIAYRLVPGS